MTVLLFTRAGEFVQLCERWRLGEIGKAAPKEKARAEKSPCRIPLCVHGPVSAAASAESSHVASRLRLVFCSASRSNEVETFAVATVPSVDDQLGWTAPRRAAINSGESSNEDSICARHSGSARTASISAGSGSSSPDRFA